MKKFIFGSICFWLIMGNIFAKTIYVPANYATIKGAVDSAEAGDEIVVSPGDYVGCQVDKKLIIRSTFDGKDWSIIENTFVQGFYVVVGSNGTIIRGFHMGSKTPVPIPPDRDINGLSIICDSSNVTIEYCIVENMVNLNNHSHSTSTGAAIIGVKGVIQNNIIRNNVADQGSAMYGCGGLIRNNVLYNNSGQSSVNNMTCEFINNTIYNSSGVSLGGKFINNIMWDDSNATSTSYLSYYSGPVPRNCAIKRFTDPGINMITSDPKFVDPSKADFHLQTTSPCIDAGLTTGSIKADIIGVQRGLKGVSETRGDGSGMDIGAYEYKPKPVSVWLPNGGPDAINAGDTLTVAWELDVPPAGTAINLQLYNGSSRIADFGFFWNANGAAESTIILPTNIPTRTTYTLRGISAWNPSLYFTAPLMTIFGKNAIPSGIWNAYL